MVEPNGINEIAGTADDTPNGTDEILMMAAVVGKALVMADTKERVFSDNDIDTVASFGMIALKPLADLASEASGLGIDLLAEAKKKLHEAQSNASSSSSTANSEPPGGSPTGLPTGPVLASGKLTNL